MANEVGQPTFIEAITVRPKTNNYASGSLVPGSNKGCPKFTLVHLPDTQNYSANYPKIFRRQTSWIVSQFVKRNIRAVLHTGDIVANGAEGSDGNAIEWGNATEAIDRLDGFVPCFISIGENDYDVVGGAPDFASTVWQENFGSARFDGTSFFGGASPNGESTFGFFTASRRTWMILNLEVDPIDESLVWAQDVVRQYRVPTIIQTHRWLDPQQTGNKRRTDVLIKQHPIAANSPQAVWERLVAPNDHIFMVISGHYYGQTRQVSINNSNKRVYEIQANFEEEIAEEDQQRQIGALAITDPVYYLSSYSTAQWQNYPTIVRVSRDSQQSFPVHSTSTSSAANLKVDKTNQKMYWSGWSIGLGNNWGQGFIMRANLDGSGAEKWLQESIEITALALDLKNGYLYYGTRGYYQVSTPGGTISVPAAIKRARLDNPVPEVIAQMPVSKHDYDRTGTVSFASSIAIDHSRNALWYTDPVSREIHRMSLAGLNRQIILTLDADNVPYHLAIDTEIGKIYYTTNNGVSHVNMDGSNNVLWLQDAIKSANQPYFANVMGGYQTNDPNISKSFFHNFLAYDQDTKTLFWNGIDYNGNTITNRSIRKASIYSDSIESFTSEALGFCGLDTGVSYSPIVIDDGGGDCIPEIDVSELYLVESVPGSRMIDKIDLATMSKTIIKNIGHDPVDVRVDKARGYFYWVDQGSGGRLVRSPNVAPFPVSDDQDAVLASSLGTVTSLAVDLKNEYLYVSTAYHASTGPASIVRFNFDGSGRVVIVDNSPSTLSSDNVNALLVDAENGFILYAQGPLIKKCDLDGANIQTLHTSSGSSIQSLAWNRDKTKLFWSVFDGADSDNALNSLWSANLSAGALSNPTKIVATNAVSSRLAVDDINGKLYFSDGVLKKLFACNFDGSGVTSLMDFAFSPVGICFAESACVQPDDVEDPEEPEIPSPSPSPLPPPPPPIPGGDPTLGPIDWLGGAGFLRYLEFDQSSSTIEVKTYSPYYDFSLVDPDNRFTLHMDFEARLGDLGKIACSTATSLDIQRDLYDPTRARTVKQVAALRGIKPDDYQPYSRNFTSKVLTKVSYSSSVHTKMSIVFVHKSLLVNATGCDGERFPILDRLITRLANEILPSRFTW